jgi:metal-responsive CopG/Arc/MetJ family transcriptional regulator
MGRKSIDNSEKRVKMGITINPHLAKMLDEQSEKEGLSKSALIENVLKNKIKSEEK